MNGALYAAVSGSLSAVQRLDITANNLANTSTAGFKAQHLLVSSKSPWEFTVPGGTSPWLDVSARTTVATAHQTVTDLSQGVIRESGNPLDVAISGPGFFVVTTPNGERYTRQGQFHLEPGGTLVTGAGYPVQGDGGEEIRLPAGQIEIDANGGIWVDGNRMATLRLVRITDPQAVIPEGGALFAARPQAPVVGTDPVETRLVQGSVEEANIDVVKGLLDLIDVARGYETYMRAMQQVDASVQMAIQQVAGI